MKGQLLKAQERKQLVDIMYISKTGEITKRRIKISKVIGDKFTAYCFTKHSSRTFIIENVLALVPLVRKEREVI
ncbi:putative DNA-binding transcriptional regulator YafY [Lysinibacillus composti]|uniref:Transcriptional regulator n=1 Tax=Lysinibacillus composti TaxID=720633 RepID=A0A3N9UIW6_9BACI|nr:transcriptional regulator [Lysinibacillus composti]MBM7607590.1 putative DNA-binding transcriptional regulator YafY [Lysinibacillus composti]RQW75905.1 transcriptional regulator [Lysinibacillus composti]